MAQPLQPQLIDVPLGAMNQQAQTTAGPVGRIRSLVNGIVKKISRGAATATAAGTTSVRVEKRDGFTSLPTAVRDPSTGATSSKTLTNATLLGTYGAQLVAIFLAAPFVLSEAAGCWESPTYNLPTPALHVNPVFAGAVNSVISPIQSVPDEQRIGTRTMYTWASGTGSSFLTMAMVIDDDGTIIRQPFSVDAVRRVRGCADGTQFWVVWDTGAGGIQANAYDTNGVFLGTGSIGSAGTGYFDVTKNTATANSVMMLQKDPATTGFKFTSFTWNGSTVVVASNVPIAATASTGRVAFLTNNSGDHNYWITTVDGAGPFTTDRTAVSDSVFTVFAGPSTVATTATAPVESAGFVDNSSNCTIALTFLDATPTPQLNFTKIYGVTSGGVASVLATRTSLSLASRAFRFVSGGDYYAVGYYHSNPVGATKVAQSTYFLMDLGTSYQVTGRFEYTTAYQDWLTTADTTRYGFLSTPQTDPNGGVHMALCYRASSQTAVQIVGDTFQQAKTLVDVVGIKDYQFGPDQAQSLDTGTAMLIGGPEANNYTGATFAEDGIGLIPEVTTIANGGAGVLTGTYEYVVVDEWTDNSGQRVRSIAGPPNSLNGASFQVTLTGLHNHVTRKQNMIRSVYRTVISNGVMTTKHYKVSGSLQGGTYLGPVVINDDAASTWTFTDNMPDAQAANNEPLYIDAGYLDRYPAPAFSTGATTFDRVFLAGYDNAVWFSGQKTEGDAWWFHPLFRLPLPTKEKIKSINVLDDFILVMCERNAMFAITNGPFPDATGAGSYPTIRQLPFTNGCTGFAETYSDGIMYSAVQGGIWAITRNLENKYIGAPIESMNSNPIIGSASDDKQRIAFLFLGGGIAVFDQVTNQWYQWNTADGGALITQHKGRFAYVNGANTKAWRQTLGQYFDNNAGTPTPIQTTVWLAYLHLGGIRRYARLWQPQMIGEYLGDHDLTVAAAVNDDPLYTTACTWTKTPAAGPYIYELPHNELTELCASVSYMFQDSFPRGASQGFALEAMSLYVGLGDRPLMLPASNQIQGV